MRRKPGAPEARRLPKSRRNKISPSVRLGCVGIVPSMQVALPAAGGSSTERYRINNVGLGLDVILRSTATKNLLFFDKKARPLSEAPRRRLCQNVILRRSRSICFSLRFEKSRCFALAQHDIPVIFYQSDTIFGKKPGQCIALIAITACPTRSLLPSAA